MTTRLATWLLLLVTVVWAGLAVLHLLDRDPSLGYTSDPGVTRVAGFVVLPGLAWLVALLVWLVVRLARPPAVRVVVLAAGVLLAAVLAWAPLTAVLASGG